MKNKIPDILHNRKMNITDFHNLLIQGGDTKLSYPIAHELATKPIVRDTMQTGVIKRAAVALGLTLDGIVDIE